MEINKIFMCVFSLILGILVIYIFSNVCDCKSIVEGNTQNGKDIFQTGNCIECALDSESKKTIYPYLVLNSSNPTTWGNPTYNCYRNIEEAKMMNFDVLDFGYPDICDIEMGPDVDMENWSSTEYSTPNLTSTDTSSPYILHEHMDARTLSQPNLPDSPMRYYVGPDPTNGSVYYDKYSDLVTYYEKNDTVVIRLGGVDEGDNTGLRRSIRLHSRKLYDNGLFVIKLKHAPEGLGVWPAWWMISHPVNGEKWACGGEIDIFEYHNSISTDFASVRPKCEADNPETLEGAIDNCYLNEDMNDCYSKDKDLFAPNMGGCNFTPGIGTTQNKPALHTSDIKIDGGSGHTSCMQTSNLLSTKNCSSGNFRDKVCGCDGASQCPNMGCQKVKELTNNTAGWGLNLISKGGIYACELTKEGKVKIWFFPGNVGDSIFSDGASPNPQQWDNYINAEFDACNGTDKNGNIISSFNKLQMVLNLTMCGDPAGAPSSYSRTKCNTNVRSEFYDDSHAYWEINYIKTYITDNTTVINEPLFCNDDQWKNGGNEGTSDNIKGCILNWTPCQDENNCSPQPHNRRKWNIDTSPN